MKIRAVIGVERVSKTHLKQVDRSGVFTDHGNKPTTSRIEEENDEVTKEIVKSLGKYPPIIESESDVSNLDVLKKEYLNGNYKPNINELADKLAFFI